MSWSSFPCQTGTPDSEPGSSRAGCNSGSDTSGMGSLAHLALAVEHDDAISRPVRLSIPRLASPASPGLGRLDWFDDMSPVKIEIPTSPPRLPGSPSLLDFKPLSPLTVLSDLDISFLKRKTTCILNDDLRPHSSAETHRPPNINTKSFFSSPDSDTFFLSTPSTPSTESLASYATEDTEILESRSDSGVTSESTSEPQAMPSTVAARDDGASAGLCTNGAATAANVATDTNTLELDHNHMRPNSARSGSTSTNGAAASSNSSPPLFTKWTRGKRQQHRDQQVKSRTSMDKGSRRLTADRSNSFATKAKANFESFAEGNKRQSQVGMPSPLTREEFEELPLAIQRKYFSTLERLRFAQNSSGMVEGISHHYDDITTQQFKRRRPRQDRSSSDHFAARLRRRSLRECQSPVADSLWYASLPDKIKKRQFTREEQVALARHLRASVILDAADEAVYKIGRRSSRLLTPDIEVHTPTLSSQPSMESLQNSEKHDAPIKNGNVPESFYDTFRWLDEEEDLDLRLFLDDYHANLREALPVPTKERRPSFRRHLSITKLPFGRSSLSSSRPATKDASTAPPTPATPAERPSFNLPGPAEHARRKSRALSLITPRHGAHESISGIDPGAAHYQDPEARLKLRVYLASPQKFDEAIEFGFPSTDGFSAAPVITSLPKIRRHQKLSDDSEKLRTFLADEDDDDDDDEEDEEEDKMDSDDQGSIPDPESPKTPHLMDRPPARPIRVATDPTHSHKPSESYAQIPASSREMTLRMTLTRPDLRANEEQIYGWQSGYQAGRKSQSQSSPLRDELLPPTTYLGDSRPKESIEQVLAGIDHWGPDPAEGGVMKRIWNRVRRS